MDWSRDAARQAQPADRRAACHGRPWLTTRHAAPAPETPAAEARDIIEDLSRSPASISPKYFYDPLGSALFDAITRLPEYYLTRTEHAVLASHGEQIAQRIGPRLTTIELGAGNCSKGRALCRWIRPARFVAIDICADTLREAVAGLRAEFPTIDARPLVTDLTGPMTLPVEVPSGQRLVFYPGSSIGNFDRGHARQMLLHIRRLLGKDGALLIGIDLPKDVAVLEAAYDDPAGVTAAFNLNALAHLNRLLGSDFDLRQWRHRAFFNADESRMEMHLEAREDIHVRWPGGGRRFAAGERIHTENSYKYPLEEFLALLASAGLPDTEVWTDARRWFAVILARP